MKNKLIAIKDKLNSLKNGGKNLFRKIIASFKHIFTYLKNMIKCSSPFLLAIIVLLVMYNGSENKRHELELKNKASESTVISEYFVSEELKTIGKIQTAEYTYSTERSITDPREFFGLEVPFTEKSLSVMYSGKIVIGYNTVDIVPTIIGKNIILQKPEPVIDNYIIKEVVMDEDNNIFNPINSMDYALLRDSVLSEGVTRATEQNIYSEAEKELENILTEHFDKLGYNIAFK